jgi:hypothetical protein
MIKRINFTRKYLKFINSDNEVITIDPNDYGYSGIISLLEVEDGIICVFSYGRAEEIDFEQRRRNVKKFDENGQELWTVSDPFSIWRIILKGDENRINMIKKHSFHNISLDKEGKVLLYDSNGPLYFLDIYTGQIVYWFTSR